MRLGKRPSLCIVLQSTYYGVCLEREIGEGGIRGAGKLEERTDYREQRTENRVQSPECRLRRGTLPSTWHSPTEYTTGLVSETVPWIPLLKGNLPRVFGFHGRIRVDSGMSLRP